MQKRFVFNPRTAADFAGLLCDSKSRAWIRTFWKKSEGEGPDPKFLASGSLVISQSPNRRSKSELELIPLQFMTDAYGQRLWPNALLLMG